jgi:hypothetical protein
MGETQHIREYDVYCHEGAGRSMVPVPVELRMRAVMAKYGLLPN